MELVYRNSLVYYMAFCALILITSLKHTDGALLSKETRNLIHKANRNGPYLGLVIPNLFEMNPLLNSPDYTPTDLVIDISGKTLIIFY